MTALKGTIILLFLLVYISANAMSTQVSSFFQDSQDNMVNDVNNVTMGSNLSVTVPVVGIYEFPNTTGVMSFINWIKLIFHTALTALGLLGVFYSLMNIFPPIIVVPIMFIGTISIIFMIIAYISNLGRD